MKKEEKEYLNELANKRYEIYNALMVECVKAREAGDYKYAAKMLRSAALELELIDLLNSEEVWEQ